MNCSTARSEETVPRYAGIEDLKRTFHAAPFTVYQAQYFRGSQGHKSTAREKLIADAAAVRNCAGRLLALFAALCRQGFDGTLSPLDVMSERLKPATGGRGEPRTIRRSLIELEKLGWIHRAYHRTGAQIMTPKGLLNLQVLRVTFTTALYQVLGFEPVHEHRPKRPLHPKTEARKSQTFGRSGFSDAVTNLQTEKGVRSDGAQLAPIGAHTSDRLLPVTEKGVRSDGAQLAPIGAHTSDQVFLIAADKEETAQKACRIASPEETKTQHSRPGTSAEFIQAFLGAVEACCFSKKYFRESGPVAVICNLLTMAENQSDPQYPPAWPRVEFDLMEWALAPWPEQQKIISDYVERLRVFEQDPETSAKTKQAFEGCSPSLSFSQSVACLIVAGKMKLRELSPKIKHDFFFFNPENRN